MFPTINKRFLFVLIGVTLALTGVLFGAHAMQARRIPDALKAQAERAVEAAGDDPKMAEQAINYFRQYLEFRPDDIDAEERLAGLLADRKRPTDPDTARRRHVELLRHYDRILRADGSRHDTRKKAIKSSLLLARYSDAETHAKALLKDLPSEQEVWLDLAYAQRGMNQPAAARESYETAIKTGPKSQSAYQEYAEYLIGELKLKDEANAVLDRLVAALPEDAESYNARSRFHARTGNEASAQADAEKALGLDPDNADALVTLGQQLQKQRTGVEAAAELYRKGMAKHPADPRFVRNLSWLELNRGNLGAAVATLEDGLVNVNERDGFDLIVSLVDVLLEMRDLDRARELIQRLERRKESNPVRKRTADQQATYVKARLAMSERDWGRAVDGFLALRRETADNVSLECQLNLLLALCYQNQGDFEQEEQSLKLVLGRDPNHPAARRTLGDAYLNAGRFEEAVAEYEVAAKNRYATTDCLAKLLRMKAAALRARSAGLREWAELDAQLTQFRPAIENGTSEFAVLRSDLLAARDDYDRAFAVLRAEAVKRPSDAALWARTAEAAAALAGVSAGLSILDEAQAVCGDRAVLRVTRAKLYAQDPARVRPLAPLAVQIDTWTEAEQLTLLYGLINAYEQIGDEQGVVRTYRRLAGRYPSDSAVWEGLYDRASRSGDEKTAAEARSMLTQHTPDPVRTQALLHAWQLANRQDGGQAAAAAGELVKLFGEQPTRGDACVALAHLRLLSGDRTAAGTLFARAVRLEPVRFGPTLAYLTFLTSTGQHDLLANLVTRLARDYRWRGDAFRRAIRQAAGRVGSEYAKPLLALAEPVVANEPGGLGWLGDCYQAVGLQSEAKRRYEQAVASRPATADDWIRLAVHAGQTDGLDAANRVMSEAQKRLANPQLFVMAAAVFAEATVAAGKWQPELGSAGERKSFTQARVAVKLSRFRKDEAISVLEDFLADGKSSASDSNWGRRNLAMMLAARGTASDRTRAKELLTGDDVTAGDTSDDKRATAAVLAGLSRQLEGEDRDVVLARAIRVLADVVSETKNPRDKFLLSQLYRSAASRDTSAASKEFRSKGRLLLQELLRTDPRNVEYYVAALDEATEPEDQEFAEKCAGFLIGNHVSDIRVVQAVARYECRTNRPEKALAHVTAYSRTADDTPGAFQERTLRAAELLDELCRMPGVHGTPVGRRMAQTAIEKYVGQFAHRPEVMIAIAGLLANDGRPDEAFDMIHEHSTELPSRVKVLAGLAVLRSCSATATQFDTVGGWINASKTEEPGSTDVLMNEGEFCALRNDLAGAERAYRAAIEIDDQQVVALNNLAWVLSTQADTTDRAMELIDRAVRVIGLTPDLLETRARVQITRGEYAAAESDLLTAIRHERTPLRLFQLALLKLTQTPANLGEANAYFRQAKQLGLREHKVHPADLETYHRLEKGTRSAE